MSDKMHHVKSWPEFFNALWDGRKTFEIRKDDRGYMAGQVLHVHEWEPLLRGPQGQAGEYTGRSMMLRIGYICRFTPGLANDVIGMSVKAIGRSELWKAEPDRRKQ